jgi:hypothetical protein
MGAMTFLLPPALSSDLTPELERACVCGGPDNMPWPTEVRVEPGRLTVRRDVDESGALVVPWDVDGAGRIMAMTSTLIEQTLPYQFRLELARGKVNQIRCQAADWQAGGLHLPTDLTGHIRNASVAFARAVTQPPAESNQQAQAALTLGYGAAQELVRVYVAQMFDARHQRQPRLDTTLGCRLGAVTLSDTQAQALMPAFNALSLDFNWKEVEPAEATYSWEPYEALLKLGQQSGVTLHAGPLIDFSAARLPDWLWLWERDLSSIASFMCDYVETTVKRYCQHIRSWQLCTASNSAAVLGLGEDEFLWLTARLVEAARQVDPKLELSVGIAQPWGEYMAVEDRTHSPFIFADTLIRSGLNLAALDLELFMGVSHRGSYCRDLLDISRLLDLYTLLGVPLRVTLAYPSAEGADKLADPDLKVTAGHWRGGFRPETQAEWATSVAGLCLCKPSVQGVRWAQACDAQPHQLPHSGLLDARNQPKPALQRLRTLREIHLR